MELGLGGVEIVEGVGDLALELVEGGVHLVGVNLGRNTLHGVLLFMLFVVTSIA